MAIAVPRQDPIEVFLADDGDICIQQDQMGESVLICVSPQNLTFLIDALENARAERVEG